MIKTTAIISTLIFATASFCHAQGSYTHSTSTQSGSYLAGSKQANDLQKQFTQPEIEKLVQPIALYPDLLLQQTLAASTFPEQLIDAATFHELAKDPQLISKQPWDASVQAIANYPSILTKMTQNLDWTLNLASAFINQSVELRAAIQRLRARAKSLGNLDNTEDKRVITEAAPSGETVIRIESTDPQVVYVPTGSTTVIYQQPVDNTNYWAPVATFGLGMAMGYAIGDDDDDDNYYYGGYYGPGFWHREDAVDDWVDYRQDRWDDAYDFANDRQDWRMDNRDDWREYQQDLGRSRQDLQNLKQQNAGKVSPEKRAEAQSKINTSKSNWQAKSPDQKKSSFDSFEKSGGFDSFDRQQASQRLNTAKSNPQMQQKAQQAKQARVDSNFNTARNYATTNSYNSASSKSSTTRANAFSGMGASGSSVNRAQARGSYSRASAGVARSAGMRSGGGGGRRR